MKAIEKPMNKDRLSTAMGALVELVARLRGPGGCPWDARQTSADIKTYLLEEAYEAVEAIEKSSPEEICMELGDLLFQIVFLALLSEEREAFDFIDVVEGITEKMIRRHPHVFGNVEVSGAAEVAANWAEIKKKERMGDRDEGSPLESVPKDLPALLRAHRLQERVSKWLPKETGDLDDLEKEVGDAWEGLKEASHRHDQEGLDGEMGGLLFQLVRLSRHLGINAEHALRMANQRFQTKFVHVEKGLKAAGTPLQDASPMQVSRAWRLTREP